jgi:hypothetical protein
MDFTPVSSSTVAAVGYEASSSTLGVRFLNGSEYHYHGVPEEVFQGFFTAGSVGRYLDQSVKKAGYSYSKIC